MNDNKLKNLRLLKEAKDMGAILPYYRFGEIVDCSVDESYEGFKIDIMNPDMLWVKHDKPFISDLIELKKLKDDNIITEEEHKKLYLDKEEEMANYGISYNFEQKEKRESEKSKENYTPHYENNNSSSKDQVDDLITELTGRAAYDKRLERLLGRDLSI